MPLRLLFFLLMACMLPGLSVQSATPAPTAELGQFPDIQAASLNDTEFHLPENLGGRMDLVLISFAREQQETVDTWLPEARKMEATHAKFRYYQLPTMARENIFYRWWFNAALRSNTTDKELRDRTLTAYVNKHKFLRSLHIANDKNVVAVLIDQSGRVYWRAEGPYTEQQGQALTAALAKAM